MSWCSDVRAAMWHLPTLPSPGPSSAWSGHRSPTWPSALKELGAQTWYRLCPLTVQGAVPLRVWVVAQLEGEAENLRPASPPPPPRCLSPGFGFLSLEVEALLGDVVVWLALWFLSSRSCGGSWRWPLVWGGVFLPLAPCCPAGDLVWVVCYPPPLQLTGSGTRGRGECSPVHRTRVHTRTHWRACPQMGTRGVTRHHVRLTRAAPL